MLVLIALSACTGTEEAAAPPSLTWLSPAEGDTVSATEGVACSLLIEEFTLQDPAKHNEGAPIGYIDVSVDGTSVLTTGETTFSLTLEAGAHDLTATLFYDDGDEVSANAEALCDEDTTDTTCGPVEATVSVTAE